jgi:hypothetical protein
MRLFEITSMPLPIKSFAKLFHVGTMNVADKRNGSYEGSGLSVSLHPKEWMQIAKIGGFIWVCKRKGNKFIDFIKLSKQHKNTIAEWAIENGFAIRTKAWRVEFYDSETDEQRYFTFADEAKAKIEADDLDTTPKLIKGALTMTPKLSQRMNGGGSVDDLIVVAYAEDVLKIDGVWWNERLDVSALSAPRGVIVPSMIQHWTFTKIQS